MVHTYLCTLEGLYITFPYLLLRAEAVVYTYPMTLYKSLEKIKISCHFGTWQSEQEASTAVVWHSAQSKSRCSNWLRGQTAVLNQIVNFLTLLTPGRVWVSYSSLHTYSNKKRLPRSFLCVYLFSPQCFSVLSCSFSVCRASSIQMTHNEVFSKCKVNKHLQGIRVISKPFQILHIRYELGSGKK